MTALRARPDGVDLVVDFHFDEHVTDSLVVERRDDDVLRIARVYGRLHRELNLAAVLLR